MVGAGSHGRIFEERCAEVTLKWEPLNLVEQDIEGMDVSRRLRVQLTITNVERGYIDLKKVSSPRGE